MSSVLVLGDRARADLTTLLGRAGRFGDDAVRLTAHDDLLVATVPITVSSGLMDSGPTILGVRTLRMRGPATFDAAVPAAAAVEALGAGAGLEIPVAGTLPAWASISPPRGGWQRIETLDADVVRIGAAQASARVERELPASPGDAVVRRVRRAVWSEAIEGSSIGLGQCVALDGLGFLGADAVALTRAQGWTRASTALGDVLAR